jgi:hypothetical protein
LACATPSLWLIHIETANRKLYRLAENKLNARAAAPPNHLRQQHSISNRTSSLSGDSSSSMSRLLPSTTPFFLSIGHLECHDKAWYYMDEQRWLDAIQETLLIILSISRLLISREHMTVEKSGIVLVVTLINGADLLAISHSLQYHDVIIERLWMYIGLILLTIGLFQMAFIDTDGLAPSSNENLLQKFSTQIHFLQDQRLCPLFRVNFIKLSKLLTIFFLIVFIP